MLKGKSMIELSYKKQLCVEIY